MDACVKTVKVMVERALKTLEGGVYRLLNTLPNTFKLQYNVKHLQYFCEVIVSEVGCVCNGSGVDSGWSWFSRSCVGCGGSVGAMVEV